MKHWLWLVVLLIVSPVWAADYTVTTNNRMETVMTRAITEAGDNPGNAATRTAFAQKLFQAGLRGHQSQQEVTDKDLFAQKTLIATQAALNNATTALNAGITPPAVTSPGNQTTIVGTPVSLQIVHSNTYGLSVLASANNLPAGLSISTEGLITGTPTTPGVSSVTVRVRLDGFTDIFTQVAFTWTVN